MRILNIREKLKKSFEFHQMGEYHYMKYIVKDRYKFLLRHLILVKRNMGSFIDSDPNWVRIILKDDFIITNLILIPESDSSIFLRTLKEL